MSLVEIGLLIVIVVASVVEFDVEGVVVVVVVAVEDGKGDVNEASLSPSRSLKRVSRGTLHPQPFKSEY